MTAKAALITIGLATVTSSLLTAAPARAVGAETLTHHGTFTDWDVFRLDRSDLKACYAATEASQFSPRAPARERPTLYVVRYPKTSTSNTIEIRFGQDITSFQSVTAKLVSRRKPPRDNFSLTTKTTVGFIAHRKHQAAFVRAMKKGREVIIVSQPGVAEILEDRYSMFGVTKALAKLEALCPGPAPTGTVETKASADGGKNAKADPKKASEPGAKKE